MSNYSRIIYAILLNPGFYYYIIYFPFLIGLTYYLQWLGSPFAPLIDFLAILSSLLIIVRNRSRLLRLLVLPLSVSLIVYFVVLFVELLFVRSSPSLLYHLLHTGSNIVLYIAVSFLSQSVKARLLIGAGICNVFLIWLATIDPVQIYPDGLEMTPYIGRPGGLFVSPTFASFAVVLLLIGYSFTRQSRRLSLTGLFFVALSGLGCLLTLSFSTIAAYSLVVVSIALTVLKSLWLRIISLITVLLALFLDLFSPSNLQLLITYISELLPVIPPDMEFRINIFSRLSGLDETVRSQYLYKYLDLALASPFFGSGPLSSQLFEFAPHNYFVLLFFECGILGLAISVVITLCILTSFNVGRDPIPGLIVAICVVSLFSTLDTIMSNSFFYVFLGLLPSVSLDQIYKMRTCGARGSECHL